MKQRNEIIDILKGIGIIFVLVGHALGHFFSQFSYTFHMPLFFLVTGLFIAECQAANKVSFSTWWRDRAKKDVKSLLYPAFFTITIILVVSCFYYVTKDSFFKDPVTIVWNDNPEKLLGNVIIPGNMWFLFALFFAKQFFYFLRYCFKGVGFAFAIFVIGGISVAIAQKVQLPFCILVGVSVLPLVWGGYYLKLRGGVEKGLPKWYNISIPIWIFYIFYGRLSVSRISYSWGYIGDLIAASGGTLFFYYVSKFISVKTNYLRKFLSFLGVYSLILICAPGIETYCFPMQEVVPQIPYRMFFILVGKVTWVAISLYACIKIPFLRKIFVR